MSTPDITPPLAPELPAQPFISPAEPVFSYSEPPPRPTPTLGDFGIFLLVLLAGAVVTFVLAGIAYAAWHAGGGPDLHSLSQSSIIAIGIPLQAVWYLLSLAGAVAAFRMVWEKPFSAGIHWNAGIAARHWWKLLIGGALLSIVVQLASIKMAMPQDAPILALFQQRWVAWMLLVFGTLIAPAAEEIGFRGFLLPSLGRVTGTVASAVVTSIAFGLMHAQQLGHAWGLVAVLFCVSMVLCYVRIRLNSVAASTMFHVGYNGFIFAVTLIATHGFTQLDKLKM